MPEAAACIEQSHVKILLGFNKDVYWLVSAAMWDW
jgi:hypothetical protein